MTDVIVIGAGVLGAFHAFFAARKGLKVTLLERNPWPAGASTRNFGMLPRTIVETTGPWAEYARDSAAIYQEVQAETDITMERRGCLYLASTPAEDRVLAEFAAGWSAQYGCAYLTAAEVLARCPFVRESYCRAGLLFPEDLSLDPSRMLARLIPWITESAGVDYRPRTNVVLVRRAGDGCEVVTAAGETLHAGRVIVCSGADGQTLFPDVLREAGLRLCKLQMMRIAGDAGQCRIPHSILSGLSLRRYPAFRVCPSYVDLERETVEPDLAAFGIHLLFKQAPDGSIIVGDSHQHMPSGEGAALSDRTDTTINDAILRYGRSMLQLPTWQIQTCWNGYYLVHPEEPIYTVTPDERIHLVTAIAGKGMTTGPGYARHSIDSIFG
jgi:FAD dependent oxidoreductase TIGR03364